MAAAAPVRDFVAFGMDFMVFHAVDAHRLKSPQTNVQGDLGGFDAALADAIENFGSEMETRGGSGNRSSLARVDGLIASRSAEESARAM